MTNWLKLAKPSWWAYQMKYRNVPWFWWRYLMTRPYPDNYTSVGDLVEYGGKHRTTAFNHETFRAYLIWRLHRHFECTSFVETGTLYGQTAGFVRRVFKTPVFTSEINRTYHIVSKANLFWAKRIRLFRSNSPEFLRTVCDESVIGTSPMFYLDAHWYDYVPLPDELAIIAERCEKGIIVIDDFLNPLDPRFRYDDYASLRIDVEAVDSSLKSRRDDVSVYVPSYAPDRDPTGKGIGYAVVLMGEKKDLPVGTFPFNLLTKISG